MLKKFSSFFIAICAILAFVMLGCGPSGVTPTGSTYSGSDVLGNTYSFSLGTNARSASKGDRFSLDLKSRDGKTRWVRGAVQSVNSDGTLTLKPDGGGKSFDVVVNGNNLSSVAGTEGDIVDIKLNDNTIFTPRTFENVYLRANRWSTDQVTTGETWDTGMSILLTDFPTNVSMFEQGRNSFHAEGQRYAVKISGISDRDLDNFTLDIQGIKDNGDWVYLAGVWDRVLINANTPFEMEIPLDIPDDNNVSYNFIDYKEIVLIANNIIKIIWNNTNADEDYGTIPTNIDDWEIIANIRNLKISIIDNERTTAIGNAGDYFFGYQEDGLSVEYKQAVWKLPSNQIANAKQSGAKFEFVMNNVTDITEGSPAFAFIWQNPASGLWWQDMTTISGWDNDENDYVFHDGVSWDSDTKKMTIVISDVIKDNRFAAANEVNFIIACWHMHDGINFEENIIKNIEVFDFRSANIVQ